MEFRLISLLLVLSCGLTTCINVETSSPIFYRGDEAGTYFGYAVELYRNRNIPSMRYVLIGAPRANGSTDIFQTGNTFRCEALNPNNCSPLDLPGLSGPNEQSTVGDFTEIIEDKTRMFMGGVVDSSYDTGEVLTCGHRYFDTNGERREPVGRCYILPNPALPGRPLTPCNALGCSVRVSRYGHCMAGISGKFLSDGSQVYLGAPGFVYFRGTLIRGKVEMNCNQGFFREEIDYFGYLGYAIASGRITDRNFDDVVVSGPRQTLHQGNIHIVNNNTAQNLDQILTFRGTSQDSYYGFSMLAVDLDGDGLDELLVSAPIYSVGGLPEIGQVLVYRNTGSGLSTSPVAYIQQFPYGRFGTALADLGDIDADGFPDIAISAPYGAGAGTVFIYSGLATGLLAQTPKQVIRGEDLGLPAGAAFGISISGKQDIDDNGYNDMLVGAYLNDSAVLLRTLPVVTISISPRNTPDFAIIDLEEAQQSGQTVNLTLSSGFSAEFIFFLLHLPVSFSTPGDMPNSMTLLVNITADGNEPSGNPRVFFVQNSIEASVHSQVISLVEGQATQLDLTVYLKGNRNFLRPITFDFDYSPVITGALDFNTSVVVENPKEIPRYEVLPNLNCGDDRMCIPDLHLVAIGILPFLPGEQSSRYDRIIAGEVGEFNISVEVSNSGEDSFGTSLQLSLPRGISYRITYSDSQDFVVGCRNILNQKEFSKISCSPLGNPLKGNDETTVRFQIVLNSLGLRGDEENIRIDLEVLSSNSELNATRDDNRKSISIAVTASADITVSLKAQPEQLVFNESTQLRINHLIDTENQSEIFHSDLGPDVTYLFLVSNRGPSPINNAALNIYWPLGATNDAYINDRAARHFLLYAVRYESDNIRCDPTFFNVANLRESQIVINEKDYTPGGRGRRDVDDPIIFLREQDVFVGRRKRQTNSGDSNIKTIFDTDISCVQFRDYCVKIECTLGDIPQDSSYELRIFAKVFEPTFAVNGPDSIWNITVYSEVKIEDAHVMQPESDETDVAQADLKLIPSRIAVGNEGFTQWWIILVVFFAFLILTIPAVVALYFCGFFKKNRSHTAKLEQSRREYMQELEVAPTPNF